MFRRGDRHIAFVAIVAIVAASFAAKRVPVLRKAGIPID